MSATLAHPIRRTSRLWSVAAAFMVLAAPRLFAQAIVLTPGGDWQAFSFLSGVGAIDDIGAFGFTVQSSTQQIRIRVTDAFVAGDAYDIFVNAVLAAQTPSVEPGVVDITSDPEVAYGHGALSWVEFFLAPQDDPYLLTINVRETVPGYLDGAGFLRADLVQDVPSTAAPEPGTVLLLAPGLFAIAVLRRRRPRGYSRPT